MLAVVGRQICQGEAVVRGHEVDGGARPTQAPKAVFEDVLRAGQTGRQIVRSGDDVARGLSSHVCEPEITEGAAVVVVPLRERDREVAGLPSSGTHVPRFGDELRVGQNVVRGHRDEERVHRGKAGRETTESGGQVKAESVHAHVARPVAQ